MRIITRRRLREFWTAHRRAGAPLRRWYRIAAAAEWSSLARVRRTFPSADAVKVASGRTVVVFNIGGNDYRLVTAIHHNTQIIYILRVMTHAEYSRGQWKAEL